MDGNDPAEENIEKVISLTQIKHFENIFSFNVIHYFCESERTMRNFAVLCEKLTIPGSTVVFLCPYGEKIFNAIGKNQSWEKIEDGTVKYKFEKMYTQSEMTPAGQKVKALLPFSDGELYEEWLVNTKALESVFGDHHLKLISKKSGAEFLEGFKLQYRSNIPLTPADIEFMGLYCVLVFKRL